MRAELQNWTEIVPIQRRDEIYSKSKALTKKNDEKKRKQDKLIN